MKISRRISRHAHRDFTLIELMIVVAIIRILAAIALPAYQNYTKKAHFAEVVSMTGAYRTAVADCHNSITTLVCCSAGSIGVPANAVATVDLASMPILNGVITLTETQLQAVTLLR